MQMKEQDELAKMIRNDYARVKCRSGQTQVDLFVLKDVKITLLDTLWLAIAYARINKRVEGIESMFYERNKRV